MRLRTVFAAIALSTLLQTGTSGAATSPIVAGCAIKVEALKRTNTPYGYRATADGFLTCRNKLPRGVESYIQFELESGRRVFRAQSAGSGPARKYRLFAAHSCDPAQWASYGSPGDRPTRARYDMLFRRRIGEGKVLMDKKGPWVQVADLCPEVVAAWQAEPAA